MLHIAHLARCAEAGSAPYTWLNAQRRDVLQMLNMVLSVVPEMAVSTGMLVVPSG